MHARTTKPLFRLFYGLKPSPAVARQSDHFAETLDPAVRRVAREHQHITLGITCDYEDYPYAVIKALLRAGTRVMAEPFDLSLDQLSINNRSAALRPSRAVPPLNALQKEIAAAMKEAGVAPRPDWSFSPHQTLFYRDSRPEQRPVEGFLWRVEQFTLICSHVGHSRHDILGTWPLKGSAQYQLF
ncbi:2'-5' RNA ligase family protein [Sphingobium bisphenolivorans]|uniref:2'-5' RNA ligase family protein n=1 Tax=Sphingobium bisphenolivorans TaxID=1335760 RepID=UPI00039B8730|nr:2'-5' RNA ligase family protein [Sphingobium bisphenolivorans]